MAVIIVQMMIADIRYTCIYVVVITSVKKSLLLVRSRSSSSDRKLGIYST